MAGENLDPENIDMIIKDLKISFDNLEHKDIKETAGFQVKLAKTIASLRAMKVLKLEDSEESTRSKEEKDSRNYILNQLDFFLYMLDQMDGSNPEHQKKKFELIMKIAQLREKLREF